MRKLAIVIAVLLLPQAAGAQEAGNRLNLVCSGGGAANKADVATANGWDSYGGSATATVVGRRSVGFDDQLQLWIEGDEGMARMPRAMLPPIHGGSDGWFKIKSIKVSENEITGSISVNPLNHPKLELDRLTGTVTLSGKAGEFNGHCAKFDPSNVQRAF